MAINVVGLVSIIVFYLIIFAVGLWAAWRQRRASASSAAGTESVMLAGRDLGTFVGILTMTGNSINQALVRNEVDYLISIF